MFLWTVSSLLLGHRLLLQSTNVKCWTRCLVGVVSDQAMVMTPGLGWLLRSIQSGRTFNVGTFWCRYTLAGSSCPVPAWAKTPWRECVVSANFWQECLFDCRPCFQQHWAFVEKMSSLSTSTQWEPTSTSKSAMSGTSRPGGSWKMAIGLDGAFIVAEIGSGTRALGSFFRWQQVGRRYRSALYIHDFSHLHFRCIILNTSAWETLPFSRFVLDLLFLFRLHKICLPWTSSKPSYSNLACLMFINSPASEFPSKDLI